MRLGMPLECGKLLKHDCKSQDFSVPTDKMGFNSCFPPNGAV